MAQNNFEYTVRTGLWQAMKVADHILSTPELHQPETAEEQKESGNWYVWPKGTLPVVLSYKESNRVPESDLTGWTEAKTLTYRFEGGMVVRLGMLGWDDHSYGMQWRTVECQASYYKGNGTTHFLPKVDLAVDLEEILR